LLLGLGFLLIAQPARALITADYPLKNAIQQMPWIAMAKVEKFDPENKRMVLVIGDSLKQAKPPYARVSAHFTQPDEDGQKDHVPQLMKRLKNDLPVVVFIEKRGKVHKLVGYSNGTWFRLQYEGEDPKEVWRFLHCETYLRRTFKGTTDEMRRTIVEDLAGKKAAPPTNPKEEPGFGPEIAPKTKTDARITSGPVLAVIGDPVSLPVLGVIPTIAIGGPLAILSMLFPTLFGKPKEIMSRYLALLTVSSIIGIVYIVRYFVEKSIKEYWWGSELALWVFMTLATLLGLAWAWRRHKAQTATLADQMPKKGEIIAFQVLSIAGLMFVSYLFGIGELFKPDGRVYVIVGAVIWSGMLGIFYLRWAAARTPDAKLAFPLEGVMLAGLTVACAFVVCLLLPSALADNANAGGERVLPSEPIDSPDGVAAAGNVPKLLGVAWTFPHKGTGTMDSTPLVTEKRIYTAVKIPGGFDNYGKIYCLDRATSKELWSFDDDGEMKAVFSTPCLADNRLYVGEGYHQDKKCKLYCLEADTGKKVWEFLTKSHTESSPTVIKGKVYIGAGDDGLYCVDAATGKQVWNYPNVHVDAAPAVAGNRVYCGSGVGDIHKETAIFAVDAETGKQAWRIPTELPVWGSPVVDGDFVYFGIGNGNFVEDADKPAGALWCVKAETGQRIWSYPVPNGILSRPALDRQTVYFTCRDGCCYAVDRTEGKLRWKKELGSPVVAAPALAGGCPHCGQGQSVYAIATKGQVYCLESNGGKVAWTFNVAEDSKKKPQLFSSPRVFVTQEKNGERRRIYFGTGLDTLAEWHATLYCLEDRLTGPAAAIHTPRAEGLAAQH
jgi:outer membrane protein assembly factor BamB